MVRLLKSAEHVYNHFVTISKQKDKILYYIYLKDKCIGEISINKISKIDSSAEFGYWLSKEYTKNGYMTEAIKICEKYVFKDLGINRLVIRCDSENIASKKIALRSGYTLEGTNRESMFNQHFNKFRDILVFSKLKREFDKEDK